MATLHMLSHSPFSDGRFSSCLPLLGDTDALLLTGDATYALTAGTKPATELEQLPEQVALFALEEDVQARALDALPARVQLLNYAGFVELTCRYQRVNSWL
ncbi:sulfurtransferase complex subunit TusB [Stutzerimonas stutzeri]|uniref:Sulfurtransferase complex subunit TusB n=1 Tax=Stutzerimonas stutzeri TaxID=316 RepID=A0A2S4ATD2_STUST|nr:sulfurtransferase complex subunit TusB [Stutzerimonas stutzeri]MCQ4261387.1 sulfurtransferase complex subunit TusB [Stutzerimonas stutzeri]POH84698.1 sulfurtransferase complex subunit TusB [Stutzerimonas stutzeri]